MTHDILLDIAVGRSRHEKNWKNKEILWSALTEKLATTHRTVDTVAEYLKLPRNRQDELKDVGGFVGGRLSGGRRKAGSVNYRQVITLDLDFAPQGFWDDFTMAYDCAACVYSTHKHTPDKPRLRLLIPLDRHVLCEEYIAIGRRIAGSLGIDFFDHTGFQPERLMYWPSTSKDGVYEYHVQDGDILCADTILDTYRDWRDSSEWPSSDREGTIVQRAIKKQGDPLEKPGVVGAFCRTYNIHDAIDTFLPDVYTHCDIEGRYSYAQGSTSGGLVTYDDLYAYSHHGTDPISGKLCNAFDLVRIHKFGLKDDDAPDGTSINKLPSYTAMVDWATKDKEVRKVIVSERLNNAQMDFEGVQDEPIDAEAEVVEADTEWMGQLDTDKKGNIHSTIGNVAIILENDPRLKDVFRFDSFRYRKCLMSHLPWRKVNPESNALTDDDLANLRKYLEVSYGISSNPKIKDALDSHYSTHTFHPIKDYFSSLVWDKQARIDTLLVDYLGAEDNEYVRTVTRKALVASVARVFRPGIKFDNMLVLVGPQGSGKSTIIKLLGGDWFSDSFSFHMLQSKEAYEQLQGYWLIEVGELAGMRKAEIERIKHFLSKQEDSYRGAYKENMSYFKRSCVLFGTTNVSAFLRDPTGERRFWPVPVLVTEPIYNVWEELTPAEVGQVWAEAIHLYKTGEPIYLTPKQAELATLVQQRHTEYDERTGIIENYLNTKVCDNWYEMGLYERRAYLQGDELQAGGTVDRRSVSVLEIWTEALCGRPEQLTKQTTREILDMMLCIPEWRLSKNVVPGVQHVFIRHNNKIKI